MRLGSYLNKYFKDYNTHGISGINDTGPLLGRPYGGCSFLYQNSFQQLLNQYILSSRACCIQLKAKFGLLNIFKVHMPCDNTSPNNFCEYNKVLSIISTYINTHTVVYCIIGGDMNTDMIRIKSTNNISLNNFIVNEDMKLVIKTSSNVTIYRYWN